MQNKFDLFSSALLFFLEIFGFAFKMLYLLPLSPIIELFSNIIEMRSVFRSFASEIDLEG